MSYLRNDHHVQAGIRYTEHLQKNAVWHTPPLLWVTATGVKHSELAVLWACMLTAVCVFDRPFSIGYTQRAVYLLIVLGSGAPHRSVSRHVRWPRVSWELGFPVRSSVCRAANDPRSHSKIIQRIEAVSYRKRSAGTQTTVTNTLFNGRRCNPRQRTSTDFPDFLLP